MGTMKRISSPIMKALKSIVADQGMVAKIGYFPSAVYPDGKPIAGIAMVQEFGVPEKNIPARPFFRPTIDEQRPAWRQIVSDGMSLAAQGKMTTRGVLTALGGVASEDVKAKISSIFEPPLSQGTLRGRARRAGVTLKKQAAKAGVSVVSIVSTKPLVDTGAMLAHLTFEVGKE